MILSNWHISNILRSEDFQMSKNQELFKNTVILGFGQMIPKLISVIVLPYLTGYLSTYEYGVYDLIITISSLCIPLISLQIQQAAFRYLISYEYDDADIVTNSFLYILIMLLFWFPLILLIGNIYLKSIVIAALVYVMYALEVLFDWICQVARGIGDNKKYSLAYDFYSTLLLIIMIMAYTIAFAFLFSNIKVYFLIKWNRHSILVIKKLLSYSVPMIISTIALWIVNLSDRLVITYALGVEITAIYSVANKIPNLFISAYNVFNLAWTENAARFCEDKDKVAYYEKFIDVFFKFMVGMLLILVSFSPFLFNILINNQYHDAYSLMPWLFLGVFFSSLVSFYGGIYVGEKLTKKVGVSSACGAIINLGINLIFVQELGVYVAAVSTILSYLIVWIYRAIDIKKQLHLKYDLKSMTIGLVILATETFLSANCTLVTNIICIGIAISYNILYNRSFAFGIINYFKTKLVKTQ